jgi:hypothetical protein
LSNTFVWGAYKLMFANSKSPVSTILLRRYDEHVQLNATSPHPLRTFAAYVASEFSFFSFLFLFCFFWGGPTKRSVLMG